jgi:hypothetical protein
MNPGLVESEAMYRLPILRGSLVFVSGVVSFEDTDRETLRNVVNHESNDTVSHTRRHVASATPLREPVTSHLISDFKFSS